MRISADRSPDACPVPSCFRRSQSDSGVRHQSLYLPQHSTPAAGSGWKDFNPKKQKAPKLVGASGLSNRSLAVTYSGMACGHTTIGAGRFHFRVRNGIGWFPLAIAARRTGKAFVSTLVAFADARSIRSVISTMHHPFGKRLGVIWSSLTGN